jgi:hypothetical protein
MLPYYLSLLLLIINFALGIGQDQITTVNNAIIDCKIISVDSSNVRFIENYDANIITIGKIETIQSFRYKGKVYVVRELSKEELNNIMQIADSNKADQDISVKIDALFPSLGIETKAGGNNSVFLCFQPEFDWRSEYKGFEKIAIRPVIRVAFRNYYNLERRKTKGKNTNKFSGDFVSINALYTVKTDFYNSYSALVPTWGIQRVFAKIVHFSAETGPGFQFSRDNHVSLIAIYVDLRLGIAL